MSGREDIFQKAMSQGHSAAWDQQWEKAVEAYQRALAEFPDSPQALTSLGLALVQLQRYDEALKAYQQAARAAPEDPIPWERVGQLQERLGELQKAVQAFWKAADLYVKSGDTNKAIENWKRITVLDPEYIGAYTNLALVYEKLGRPAESATAYLAAASLLQHAGNLEKAKNMLGHAQRLMPNSTEVRQALTLMQSGRPLPKPQRPKGGTAPLLMAQVRRSSAAIPTERQVDPVAEARRKAITRLAEILFEFSEEGEEQATAAGRRGMQAIVKGTGPLSLQTGEKTKILLHLSQAIEAQTSGQDAQAIEEMERALAAGFKDSAIYYDLGLLYFQRGRLESALRYLQHAVHHSDYAMPARLIMGQILRQMKRLPEAVVEYMEALKIADSAVIESEQAAELRQLYEPLIEAQSQQNDPEAQERLCRSIHDLLMRPNWRAELSQARQQLPEPPPGAPPLPLAEMLTQAQSSQVVEAISQVNRLLQEGHLRSAMELAFDAIEYAPTYLPLHTLIGEILVRQGNRQDALTKFEVVAHSYSVRGEASQAVNLLRRVVQLAPMDLAARTRLIDQLIARGQVDEALAEYLELAETYYRLAELDLARKTYASALRQAQQSATNRSWSLQILRRMADIDIQRLDWRQALRIYEQIRTLQPDDLDSRKHIIELNLRLNQVSQAEAELGNYLDYLESNRRRAEAIDLLEALVEENPSQPLLRSHLAEEYRRVGRVQDAVEQLDALGELLLDAGDKTGAIRALQAIIALNPPNVADFRAALNQLQGAT